MNEDISIEKAMRFRRYVVRLNHAYQKAQKQLSALKDPNTEAEELSRLSEAALKEAEQLINGCTLELKGRQNE